MNTHDWMDLLARGAGPAPRAAVARRLVPATAAGLCLAVVLSLGWPLRSPELGTTGAVLAMKLAYTGAVALAAGLLAAQLARPVWRRARLFGGLGLLAAAVGAMGLLAAATGWAAGHWQGVNGQSGAVCAWTTAGLSAPALIAGLWALKGLAPTRPVLAGAAVGLMAGGCGALAYALVCPETSPVFVGVWYTLAMLMPAAAGAALGWRWLRW